MSKVFELRNRALPILTLLSGAAILFAVSPSAMAQSTNTNTVAPPVLLETDAATADAALSGVQAPATLAAPTPAPTAAPTVAPAPVAAPTTAPVATQTQLPPVATNDTVIMPPTAVPPVELPSQSVHHQMGGQPDVATVQQALPPGMTLPTDEATLRALENDPEHLEQVLRQEAFDASVNGLMPLKPNEIKNFIRSYDSTQEAVETPVDKYPEPEVQVQTVSLEPGAKPLNVDLALGHVTTLNMVDVSGSPWPIQDIGWAGNFEVLQPEQGSHILRITPLGQYSYGNVSLRLVGLNTPLILTLRTSKDRVLYRMDVRVPDYGPKGKPPLIETGISTKAGDKSLTSILEGVPPANADRLIVDGVDGRTSAFAVDGQTYVRTPYTLLSPAWSSSVKSADGMNVYAIDSTPVLLLSDRGKMVRAKLKQKEVKEYDF